MTDDFRIRSLIEEAGRLKDEGRLGRRQFRRRGAASRPQRELILGRTIREIEAFMPKVRSEMGRLAYLNISEALQEDLREASRQLQMERHQLLKMLGRRQAR